MYSRVGIADGIDLAPLLNKEVIAERKPTEEEAATLIVQNQ
jgi:hypothetical protein